jgi:hypothetical protein
MGAIRLIAVGTGAALPATRAARQSHGVDGVGITCPDRWITGPDCGQERGQLSNGAGNRGRPAVHNRPLCVDWHSAGGFEPSVRPITSVDKWMTYPQSSPRRTCERSPLSGVIHVVHHVYDLCQDVLTNLFSLYVDSTSSRGWQLGRLPFTTVEIRNCAKAASRGACSRSTRYQEAPSRRSTIAWLSTSARISPRSFARSSAVALPRATPARSGRNESRIGRSADAPG